jgi:hypothetical protein
MMFCLIRNLYFSYIKLSQNNRKVISAWKNAFMSASPVLIAGLGTSFSIHLSKTLRRYLGCVTFNRCITTLYKLGTVVEHTLKICISFSIFCQEVHIFHFYQEVHILNFWSINMQFDNEKPLQ